MPYTYLALGDSYTIGEAEPITQSFPYQTVQLLRQQGLDVAAPEIVARTGWTTDELQAAVNNYTFSEGYDFVSLLIGVNNQYRGYSLDVYQKEFETLLQLAIPFARNKKGHVAVLSIPDYSVTTFAQEKDPAKIQKEIETFNAANKAIAEAHSIHYINITESTRQAKNNVNLLASDGLHPSAEEYKKWAVQLAQKIKSVLS
ncbi:MAG: SGNH/GDSL hydrolase family protein [Chitinophagaceae bacterium]